MMFYKLQNILYQSLPSCKRTQNEYLFHLSFPSALSKSLKHFFFGITALDRHYHFNEHQHQSKSHKLYISGTQKTTNNCGRPHRSSCCFRYSISFLDCHLRSSSVFTRQTFIDFKTFSSSKGIKSDDCNKKILWKHAFIHQN